MIVWLERLVTLTPLSISLLVPTTVLFSPCILTLLSLEKQEEFISLRNHTF